MPSAANVKIDKQITPENALVESNTPSPLRQAITVIEHKIRNLEKRKSKLESYRELQNSGKDLNQDQKTAVARYDEVVQTLDFARDLCKQFLGIVAVSEKEAKKQARKDASAKSQAELAKVREVLLVQDALTQMGQDNIREDFLAGRNGAATLMDNELKLLDDLYPAVTPKHEAGDPNAFTNQVQAAAEHLLAVVDGKPKEVFGGTYSQIKEVIGKIHESGYLDQTIETAYVETTETVEIVQEIPIVEGTVEVIPPANQESLQPIESLTIKATSIQPVNQMQPIEPTMDAIPAEPMFYQQPHQPPRPISEVIGTGSFFFLQESEIDTPEQIPSQTFTNQSFVTSPPPPIPMPPHFQNFNNNPIPQPGNNGVEEHQELPDESQKQRGRPRPNNNQQFYSNNNGYNRPRQNRNGPRSGNRHNQ